MKRSGRDCHGDKGVTEGWGGEVSKIPMEGYNSDGTLEADIDANERAHPGEYNMLSKSGARRIQQSL